MIASKKEIRFEKDVPLHLVGRAVEGKKIFLKKDDAFRFIFQMYVANIGRPGRNLGRTDIKKIVQALLNNEEISQKFVTIDHPPLVNLLSFALVVNHHHFILTQNIENGISKYRQKMHSGFAKYFNLKHDRKDILFERRYGVIPVQTGLQLDAVVRYVNIKNPLDVYQSDWRKQGLKNKEKALKFLNEYPFSSFPNIFGGRTSKILAPASLIEKYLGDRKTENQMELLSFVDSHLQKDLAAHQPLFLEEE
jgi:hypothetical protein